MDPSIAACEIAVSESEFQRVEALFQAAADLPAAEREAFLIKECDGDKDLQSRVQRLLDRLDQDTSPSTPLADRNRFGAATQSAAIPEGPGSVIDRYKLLQIIGDGIQAGCLSGSVRQCANRWTDP